MNMKPEIKPMGSGAILIDFEPEIKPSTLDRILNISEWLRSNLLKVKVEVINAYSSILVIYHSPIDNIYDHLKEVEALVANAPVQKAKEKYLFHIPVCYDEKFAIDMDLFQEEKNLSRDEVVTLHSSPIYTVYFIGFLPGFLYLGGLDTRLAFPRKSKPRQRIEKGAVGIGEKQTGIYPQRSPGGWQIIGNSPAPLFKADKVPPCAVSPGDKVQFYPIDLKTHSQLTEEVRSGRFQYKRERYNG